MSDSTSNGSTGNGATRQESSQPGVPAATNRFQRAAELFEAVRQLVGPERERALVERCGDDGELLVEVRSLLAFHDRPSETLDTAILKTGVGATIGRYRIADVLGEGGMGTVYLAVQEEPVRREVALKVIKLGMDTRQVVRRFEAERQAIAQMEHPNVARVLDAGSTSDGRPYFVMELVRGQPIIQFCDSRHFPVRARVRLFLDICAAVQHAHQKGVIHRDLKPSNILVADVDGRPVAKVIDFGIAKALWRPSTDRSFTTTLGDAVGTPDYMSPEQAGGGDVDVRSDVYALGVILYELLVGMTPLRARLRLRSGRDATSPATVPPLDELRRLVREEDPLRVVHALHIADTSAMPRARDTDARSLGRMVRGDLEAITMKALALKPGRRYATVAALYDDLERHLRDEPVTARPPSAAYSLAKYARRHTATLVAACLVIAAILIGLVLALVGFEQARHERDIARSAQQNEARLADDVRSELFRRDIDRGRQRQFAGNLTEARDLLWAGTLARPESLEARWGLREMMWARGPFVFFWLGQSIRCVETLPIEGRGVVCCEWQPPALLDMADGSVHWMDGPPLDVSDLAVSPDATLVACTDLDGVITLWDVNAKKLLRSIPAGPSGQMPIVFDGPDHVVIARSDGDIRRVRIDGTPQADAEPLSLARTSGPCLSLARSAQGMFAVGLQLGHVLLIDPPDAMGYRALRDWSPHDRSVIAVAFDPRGGRLATASTARDYAIADAESLFVQGGGYIHPGSIQGVAFNGDGTKLVIAGWWDTLSIDVLTGERQTVTPLLGSRMSISPSGKTYLFGPSNRYGAMMLLTGDQPLVKVTTPPADVQPLDVNLADGSAVGTDARGLCGISLDDHDRGSVRWHIPNNARVRFLRVSPDGTRVAVLNADRTVRVFTVPEGRELAHATNAHIGEYNTLDFDESGEQLAYVTRTNGVRFLDLATGGSCVAVMPLESEILGISFDPRGHRLAVCQRSGVNRIYSLFDEETITTIENRGAFSVDFSADGQTLAMGQWLGDVLFWAPDTNEGAISRGHSAFPSRTKAHPKDPDLFLTCADDGTVRVWHRSLEQDLLALAPYGPRQAIRHVDWSRDGTCFHIIGPDRVIRTYSISEADRLTHASEAAERTRLGVSPRAR